jgi:hypothetical protein
MKKYRQTEIELHTFLIFAPDGDKQAASHCGCWTPRTKKLVLTGWKSPISGLDLLAKIKIPVPARNNSHHPIRRNSKFTLKLKFILEFFTT